MALCYQAADLTIVPSEYETFGRVAAESLFCGTPVLAFETGGLSDIVTPNVCGRLVPARDVEALMDQIADLKNQPQTVAAMRLGCVHDVSRRFSTTQIANDYLQVYDAAISGYAA
jgi:glycosyltransferase involved in cell wall biosynthesis